MSETGVLDGLQLVGGRPCLDFINTEGLERNGPPERLPSYEALVQWSVLVGVIDQAAADRLIRGATRSGSAAANVLERAVELREAMYRIFAATIDGTTPTKADRTILDVELGRALAHLRAVPADQKWDWQFVDGDELDSILWPLTRDAADLLTSRDIDRMRECSGTNCAWLFVDQSRNRSRRWCDMAECGNRSKARRFYRRQKGGA